MKILIIALVIISITGCERRLQVYHENDKSSWVCEATEGHFKFEGEGAQEKAHERCDSFLVYYQRINEKKGEK